MSGEAPSCFLCGRPLGERVEWHHRCRRAGAGARPCRSIRSATAPSTGRSTTRRWRGTMPRRRLALASGAGALHRLGGTQGPGLPRADPAGAKMKLAATSRSCRCCSAWRSSPAATAPRPSDPAVRRASPAAGLAGGARPVRVLLISDIHVAGPDMPPSRLARLVGRMNALAPDIVLIAGDLVSDKRLSTRRYGLARGGGAARRAEARRWGESPCSAITTIGAMRRRRAPALAAAGVRLLDNDAVAGGPARRRRPRRRVHRPGRSAGDAGADAGACRAPGSCSATARTRSPGFPPTYSLMLAGHTHCGQIALPLVGPLSTMSDYGEPLRLRAGPRGRQDAGRRRPGSAPAWCRCASARGPTCG